MSRAKLSPRCIVHDRQPDHKHIAPLSQLHAATLNTQAHSRSDIIPVMRAQRASRVEANVRMSDDEGLLDGEPTSVARARPHDSHSSQSASLPGYRALPSVRRPFRCSSASRNAGEEIVRTAEGWRGRIASLSVVCIVRQIQLMRPGELNGTLYLIIDLHSDLKNLLSNHSSAHSSLPAPQRTQ